MTRTGYEDGPDADGPDAYKTHGHYIPPVLGLTLQEMLDGWAAFRRQALPADLQAGRQLLKVMEELGELAKAVDRRDRVGIVDGVGDVLYTLLGIAVTEQVPLAEVWQRIHASNLTKSRSGDLSPRGTTYVPPKLEGL